MLLSGYMANRFGWWQIAPKEALNKLLGNTSIPSGAKAHVDFAGFTYGLKPVPFKTSTYSEVP
jgi:hypothetical protein